MKSELGQRVLIAEDSRVISDVIRLNLNRAGYVTEEVMNGRQAWEQLLSEPFDLLITDFQMPEIQGDELCRLLRQCPLNYEIPVILISSKGFELDFRSLQDETGIAAIVYKPFSPRQIVETVNRVLRSVTLTQTN